MSGHLLSVESIRSGYVGSKVLNELSLTLEAGEILGVIGRNGVGKTTLMRTLMGILPTDGGDILLDQRSIAQLSADARAREGLGYVPQGRDVFPGLTVQENLQVGMQKLRHSGAAEMEMALKFFPMLLNKLKQKAGTMSGGEQQQLAIARALVGNPRVLLLDEPSEGVQPSIVQTIAEKLLEIARTLNIGILLVEQNMYMVEHTASRCCVMEKGRIVDVLTPQQLKDDSLLRHHLAI